MNRRLTILFLLSLFSITISTFYSCTKDKARGLIDEILFDIAREQIDFVWFKHSDTFLDKSSGSGHNYPLLRTRFNAVAALQLDSAGRIKAGARFAEGSIVVKELINSDGSIQRYAILYKQSEHESADAQGWVWGYINVDGSIAAPAEDKGKACISCHSQDQSIDYMLMNKFFP